MEAEPVKYKVCVLYVFFLHYIAMNLKYQFSSIVSRYARILLMNKNVNKKKFTIITIYNNGLMMNSKNLIK